MDLEHVQPVRSLTPDGSSRARNVVAVAFPILALVFVVGAGIAGRSADDDGRPNIAEANASPSARASTPRPTRDEDSATLIATGFPTDAIGLPVGSVRATLDRHRGPGGNGVIAIAGWLTVPPVDGCDQADGVSGPDSGTSAAGDVALLCRRDTMLLDDPRPVLAADGEALIRLRAPGPHLHPQAMPGISLDAVTDRQDRDLGGTIRPVPVVVVGRFGDARLPVCVRAPRHCVDGFAIERLIWVDGEWQLRRAERSPVLADTRVSGKVRWHIVDAAFEHNGLVLNEVLVPRDTLKRIDPIADVTIDARVDGPVWYIRTLLRSVGSRGPARSDIGWAVIEDATGIVLGAGGGDRRTSAAD